MSATLSAGPASLLLNVNTPLDTDGITPRDDIAGIKVWYSTISTFDPNAGQGILAYNGTGLSITITGVTPGTIYYVKYALISSIDPDIYTVSANYSAVPNSSAVSIDISGYTSFTQAIDNSFTPSSATLTAISQNITNPSYSWSVSGSAPTSGTGSTIRINPLSSATSITVVLTVIGNNIPGGILTKTISLPIVYNGQTGQAGTSGTQVAYPSIYQWTSTSTPPAQPTTTGTYTWASAAYTAPSGWTTSPTTNTTPGSYLWSITIPLVASATVTSSSLAWNSVSYPIRAVAYNGTNGAAGSNGAAGAAGSASFVITRVANDSSVPTDAEVIALIGRAPVAGDLAVVSYNNYNGAVNYKYTTSWALFSTYLPGSLIVDGTITGSKIVATSITADKIDARGLSIKDADGNIILSAGNALPVAYAPAGSLNSEIKLGGRNLLLGSASGTSWIFGSHSGTEFVRTASSTVESDYIYSPYFSMWGNQEITLSFESKEDAIITSRDLFILPDNYASIGLLTTSFNKSTTYTKYYFTFTTPAAWGSITSPASVRLRIDHNGSTTGASASIYARNIKIELGNKATDWSPAPEDSVYTDLSNAPSSIKNNNISVSIGTNGILSASGGPSASGGVTIGGLGYSGDLNANKTYVDGSGAIQGVSSGANTQVDNSFAVTNQNRIPNSDQTQTICFVRGWTPNGSTFDIDVQYSSLYWGTDSYTLGGNTTRNVVIHQSNNNGSGSQGVAADYYPLGGYGLSYSIPVVPGQKYIFSCYIQGHRCGAEVGLVFFDSTGYGLSSNESGFAALPGGGAARLEQYSRRSVAAVAPSTASGACLFARKYNTLDGYTESYMWMAAPQFEAVNTNVSVPGPYVPGPPASTRQLGYFGDLNATYGADWSTNVVGASGVNSAITTAQSTATNALNNRLAKSGADTLVGPISLNAATAILVGDTTNGLYLGSSGIVGRKAGNTTFSVDNAGNAIFKGDITGASGTFYGNVTAGSITTDNIYGGATSKGANSTSMGNTIAISISVPAGATAIFIDYYIGLGTIYTSSTGSGKTTTSSSVYYPATMTLTDSVNGGAASSVGAMILSPAEGTHTITLTRSGYDTTTSMRLSILVLKR